MENPTGKIRLDSWAFLISTELVEHANQIAVFLITFTKLRNVLLYDGCSDKESFSPLT